LAAVRSGSARIRRDDHGVPLVPARVKPRPEPRAGRLAGAPAGTSAGPLGRNPSQRPQPQPGGRNPSQAANLRGTPGALPTYYQASPPGGAAVAGGECEVRGVTTSIQASGEKVVANVERVIVGKHHEVRLALVALLCRGHLLIEDVPGTGKTVLAKAIARSLGCTFRRIQFTPDLLPSDVTGLSIYNQKTQEFEFRPGPIMAQIVLADEINRATPKTQSALLECMEERQATIDGVTYPMPEPFMVIATQNPIEYEGTFALPEAQLDRFMLRLRLGYPDPAEEIVILDEQKLRHPLDELDEVCSVAELQEMQRGVREVYVDPAVADYIVRIVDATRRHPDVYLGASPRGSIALYRAGQAWAALQGRDFVIPDDIKVLAEPALAHRLIIKTSAAIHDIQAAQVIREILETVPVEGGTPSGGPRAGVIRPLRPPS
jgi:MoxR-like ATPase